MFGPGINFKKIFMKNSKYNCQILLLISCSLISLNCVCLNHFTPCLCMFHGEALTYVETTGEKMRPYARLGVRCCILSTSWEYLCIVCLCVDFVTHENFSLIRRPHYDRWEDNLIYALGSGLFSTGGSLSCHYLLEPPVSFACVLFFHHFQALFTHTNLKRSPPPVKRWPMVCSMHMTIE